MSQVTWVNKMGIIMFDRYLSKFLKKKNADVTPADNENRGSIICTTLQARVNKLKPKIEVAELSVDRNKWAIAAIILAACLLLSLLMLYQENERFANHVKVAFVKLDPSGTYNISFADENSKPTYFLNTVYSLLSNYVERRYSKVNYSINSDYGYALNFMSAPLKNDFLNNYKAAKVAADFIACKSCQQVRVIVRNIQNDESDEAVINGNPGTIYHSTVFIRAEELNPDGTQASVINQIVTLTWTIKNIAALPNNLNSLQANPIGIEILNDSLKDDPTPVAN